jgi:rhodanese-related sulfurtransferase
MGATLIPLGNIVLEEDKISKDKLVVIHCRSGARSAAAIMQLEQQFGFTNLFNLKGGILAWIAMNETQTKA